MEGDPNLVTAYAPQYANNPDLFQHTIGALGLLVYATTLAKPWTVLLQADPSADTSTRSSWGMSLAYGPAAAPTAASGLTAPASMTTC